MSDVVTSIVADQLIEFDARADAVAHAVNCTLTPKEGLELVNKVRTAIGAEPLDQLPTGRQSDPQACVIAKALTVGDVEASVGGDITLTGIDSDTSWHLVQLGIAEEGPGPEDVTIHDDVVQKFVHAFDSGDFEELIA